MTALHESALDALGFLENVIEGNQVNWEWSLDNVCAHSLLVGMTKVAKSLLLSLAAEHGQTVAGEVELLRAMLLQAAAGAAS